MIIPVGYGHVQHIFRQDGTDRKAAITFGVQLQGVDFGENRVEDLHQLFGTEMMGEFTANTTLERTLLKYGPQATGPTFEYAQDIAGPASVGVAPPNVTFLVRKRTALGGRANRGRLFLPGVAEAAVQNGGEIAAGTIAALQTACNDWLAGLTTLQMPMVLLHNASSDPTDVSQLVVDSTAATQRRRLRA